MGSKNYSSAICSATLRYFPSISFIMHTFSLCGPQNMVRYHATRHKYLNIRSLRLQTRILMFYSETLSFSRLWSKKFVYFLWYEKHWFLRPFCNYFEPFLIILKKRVYGIFNALVAQYNSSDVYECFFDFTEHCQVTIESFLLQKSWKIIETVTFFHVLATKTWWDTTHLAINI